jgi:hypothetical protein
VDHHSNHVRSQGIVDQGLGNRKCKTDEKNQGTAMSSSAPALTTGATWNSSRGWAEGGAFLLVNVAIRVKLLTLLLFRRLGNARLVFVIHLVS